MLAEAMRLAWYFFRQEYSQVHHRLLRWTQSILLVFIISLSQSSASIQLYLNDNLQSLLGADAVISQQYPLTNLEYAELKKRSDSIVLTQQIQATLTHNSQWQNAKIKAVDADYPLQGDLLTSLTLKGSGEPTTGGPKKGEIWLGTRLLAGLSLTIGDVITVAGHPFIVAKVLIHEPDRLMEGHSVDMRAMINVSDLRMLNFSADLIQHRYLVAANQMQINALITWQKTSLPAAVIQHKNGAHPLALFWQRTENVLGLMSLILFFMATIAIDQLAQVQIRKDQYFCAVCRSFGVPKVTGIKISMIKWLISLLLLLPIVWAISALLHYLIVSHLQETFEQLQWHLNINLTLKVTAAVSLLFALFHLPVWNSLMRTSVGKLFSGKAVTPNRSISIGCSFLVLLCIAMVYSDNIGLTSMMITAMLMTLLLLKAICWLTLTLGEKLTQHRSGVIPFTLFMMKQRLITKSTQILGIGLCAFLLLFSLMLLKDLGATMASYQRQHDGNVLISQATSKQLGFIEPWAQENNLTLLNINPYLYAKLIAINQTPLAHYHQKPSDSLATLSQAIRLHWNDALPKNNSLVEGEWWTTNQQHWQQVSVEQEVMIDLGLTLGDSLTFFIEQRAVNFQITASHQFKPGHGSITFWVQMPTAAFLSLQAASYYMASMELDEHQWPLLTTLWQRFPTLGMISLKEITERFDKTLGIITQIISGFSVMIILLASVVVLASVSAFESKEHKKNSIIMSFGFSRQMCLKINIFEWIITALIAAFGAIIGTYLSGTLIYQSQFSLVYQPDVKWLLLTLLIILSLVTGLGVYASKRSLRSSIRELMSEQ